MKRAILLLLSAVHILLSIALFFVGKQYAFILSTANSWLSNLLISMIVLVFFIFSKSELIKKMSNALFVVYPLGIFLIIVLVMYELPNFTYLEASKLIEENTGEIVIEDIKGKPKGQVGIYNIYTAHHVYIFDAITGEYAKRRY